MKRTIPVLCLMVALCGTLMAADPVGKVLVSGVADRYKSANNDQRTSSLKNVGVGERVVFMASATDGTGYGANGLNVTSATWAVLSAPPGSSAAAPQDTAAGLNGTIVYFVPDSVGSYTIQMSAVTDSGAAPPVSITLTAGKFKGVGNYNITSGGIDNFNCTPCHSSTGGKFSEWTGTGHASAMARKIDTPGGYFSNGCLPCHSVGWDTAATAVNDGFDDVMPPGFAVPTPGYPGLYDSLVAAQQAVMALGSVQCENCHGPAAQHAGTGDKTKLDKSYSADVCGVCHIAAGRRHQQGFAWTGSDHTGSVSSRSDPQSRNRPLCNRCHTAQGYVNQVIKGNPEPVVPSGETIWPDGQSITCAACHDPHSDANPHQLRRASVAEACTGCHTIRITSSGLHGNHQGPMILGVNAEPYSGQEGPIGDWAGWELPGYTYQNSTHSSIDHLCAQCHMAHSPTYDPAYATDDTLVNKVGDHTFAVLWDNDTPDDETDDTLNSVGCQDCHGEVGLQFVRLSQDKIKALLDTLKSYLPLMTTGFRAGQPVPFNSTDSILTPIQKAGSYNYYFVNNESSFGVHNHRYASGLLESSIEQLKLGQGAGSITSVTDVPADQGKQVQIVWGQFPAELFSLDRAETYGIWRLDDNPIGGTGGVIQQVNNFQEMLMAGPVGTVVQLGDYVSSFVGSVPSTGLDEYAFIAPTLLDSTVNEGMNWSHFVIAAYSANNTKVYLSAPDSGYSVDNLDPVTPTGLAAAMAPGGVQLTWNAPADPDIDVYDVYRSTTAGFDPTGMQPIASVKGIEYLDQSVQAGTQYYWKIAAVDFSGNESDYSGEITLVVTDIQELVGLPT
ncbi:MAG: hypothetical protein KAJ12_12625, partial [Bacteroidetes bacterium]|nr:hypothetical protein [Bacteroidota bacterium]